MPTSQRNNTVVFRGDISFGKSEYVFILRAYSDQTIKGENVASVRGNDFFLKNLPSGNNTITLRLDGSYRARKSIENTIVQIIALNLKPSQFTLECIGERHSREVK